MKNIVKIGLGMMVVIVLLLGWLAYCYFADPNYQYSWLQEKIRMESKKDPVEFAVKGIADEKIEMLVLYVHTHFMELTQAMGGPQAKSCQLTFSQREEYKKKFWNKAKQEIPFFPWGDYSQERYIRVIAYEIPRLAGKEGIVVIPNAHYIGEAQEIGYQIGRVKSINKMSRTNWESKMEFPIIDMLCEFKIEGKEFNVGQWNPATMQAILGAVIIFGEDQMREIFDNQFVDQETYEEIKKVGENGYYKQLCQAKDNTEAIDAIMRKIVIISNNMVCSYDEFRQRNITHESQHLLDYNQNFQDKIGGANSYLFLDDHQLNMGVHQEISAVLAELRYGDNPLETLIYLIQSYLEVPPLQDYPHHTAAKWVMAEMIKEIKDDIAKNRGSFESEEYALYMDHTIKEDWQILWQIPDLLEKRKLFDKLIDRVHEKYVAEGYKQNLAPGYSVWQLKQISVIFVFILSVVIIVGRILYKKFITKTKSNKKKRKK